MNSFSHRRRHFQGEQFIRYSEMRKFNASAQETVLIDYTYLNSGFCGSTAYSKRL